MPPVNEAAVAGSELEKVRDKLAVAYESDDMFYGNIKKREVEIVSYREMRAPIEIETGGNFAYFDPDGGDMGRGSGPTIDKATLKPVFVLEGLEYTKLSAWATDDARKAIINSVRRMTARGIVELRRQVDAQLQGAGTGQIGTVTTPTAGAGFDTVTFTTDGFGVRLFRPKQVVQIFDTTVPTAWVLRGKAVVSQWDVANKTCVLTPNTAGITAGDALVVDGLSNPNSLPALYGVPYHQSNSSTGTWLGFDRSTTPSIRSNRVNAASAPLTLPLPRLAINMIGARVGIDNQFKATAWMNPCQMAAYEQIGQLSTIINRPNGGKDSDGLSLYFSGKMEMAGAPVRGHFNWNQTRIDFIVDSVWGRAEILPIGFYTVDGRKIFELRGPSGGVATSDIFYMVNGFQTFVTNPAATAYIDNLAVPAGY